MRDDVCKFKFSSFTQNCSGLTGWCFETRTTHIRADMCKLKKKTNSAKGLKYN